MTFPKYYFCAFDFFYPDNIELGEKFMTEAIGGPYWDSEDMEFVDIYFCATRAYFRLYNELQEAGIQLQDLIDNITVRVNE